MKKRRALLSVSDKRGIVEFAKGLQALNFEIICTDGVFNALHASGVKALRVSDVTGFSEILDGRVKTLHPHIHAGILALRDSPAHMEQISSLNILPIDLVAVNLYPFKENGEIDIGGPAMLRAAAKNYRHVTTVVYPDNYEQVLKALKEQGEVDKALNFELAIKAFEHTAHYDAMVAQGLQQGLKEQNPFPNLLTLTYEKVQDMRYGENPHQRAALYKEVFVDFGTVQIHGKELSFNNINDAHGALELLQEYNEPTIVACKHATPCGVASGNSILDAYRKAYAADPVSIFGGIVAANNIIDEETAAEMANTFLEVILAPGFTKEALGILTQKKNIRLLTLMQNSSAPKNINFKKIPGGLLVQETDDILLDTKQTFHTATKRAPSEAEKEDLLFAWKIAKYVKSNGIAICKNKQSVGIASGHTSRIMACRQAIMANDQNNLEKNALRGAVLASDAFFPFPDCVEEAAAAGITAIIQPGGSMRDEESINACNKYDIAMVLTGIRHFLH